MATCILRFRSLDKLERHLNYGRHKFEESKQTQLSRVTDNWVQQFQEGSNQRPATSQHQEFFVT